MNRLKSACPTRPTALSTYIRASLLGLSSLALVAVPMVSHADLTPSQQDLTKLYLASFLRAPELGGLNYWNAQLTAGSSLQTVGGTIFSIPIVREIYPQGMSDKAFVEAIYGNVFQRESDPEGLKYWMDELAAWHLFFELSITDDLNAYRARGQLVMNMINAGLGTPDGTAGKASIVNRLNVAKLAAEEQIKRGVEIPPEKLKTIGACVNSNASSTTTALDEIQNFYNPSYKLGGTVTGLTIEIGLSVKYGCGKVYNISSNGAFNLPEGFAPGVGYSVSINSQPKGQECTVANGVGKVAYSDVNNIGVSCVSATDGTGIKTGYLYDSPVFNLDFTSCNSSRENCLKGRTDKNGAFQYREGDYVKFHIYGLEFDYVKADPLMTPQKLTPNPSVGTRIVQLLQSLDEDADPSNGIVIPEAVRQAANIYYPTTTYFHQQDVKQVLSKLAPSATLVSEDAANQHAQKSGILERLLTLDTDAAKAVIGMKTYSSDGSFNLDALNDSARARLDLHYFYAQQRAASATYELLTSSLSEIDKNREGMILAIEYLKLVADSSVALKGVSNTNEIPLDVATDLAVKAVDFTNQNIKVAGYLGGSENVPSIPEQGIDAAKGVSGLFSGVVRNDLGKGIGGGTDLIKSFISDPVARTLVSATGSAAQCLNDAIPFNRLGELWSALKRGGVVDVPIPGYACIAGQAELLTKSFVDIYSTVRVIYAADEKARNRAAMEYLDAYYRAGGDWDYFRRILNTDLSNTEDILLALFYKNGGNYLISELAVKKEHVDAMLLMLNDIQDAVDASTQGILSALDYDDTSGFAVKIKSTELITGSIVSQGAPINLVANYAFAGNIVGGKVDRIYWIVNGALEDYSVISTANAANLVFNKTGLYSISVVIEASDSTGKKYFETSRLQLIVKPVSYRYWLTFFNTNGGAVLDAKEGETVSLEVDVDPLNSTVQVPLVFTGLTSEDLTGIAPTSVFVSSLSNSVKMSFAQRPGTQGNRLITASIPGTNVSTSITLRDSGATPPIDPTKPTGKLNDTGIVTCVTSTGSHVSCSDSKALTPSRQDAMQGRDYTANQGLLAKVGGSTPNNGKANGFDFTKIGSNGQPLAIQNGTWNAGGSEAAGSMWDCVRDNVTGLLWENKSDDNGLRDKDWTYTWYNSNIATNGGNAGTASRGRCFASGRCDTEKYVADVNAAGLCGHNDWRMPTRDELRGIPDLGRVDPAIDSGYFPNTLSYNYWSGLPRAYDTSKAIYVSFSHGTSRGSNKYVKYPVRLVRGQ